MGKNPPARVGSVRDTGLIPGLGKPAAVANDSLLQYSCLENPVDRGAWWAVVCVITNNQTGQKRLSTGQHSVVYLFCKRHLVTCTFFFQFLVKELKIF